MTPVWPIRGGRGVKLTSYLDSPHMVSYYLPVHFIALNAILKKIIGGVGLNLRLSDWKASENHYCVFESMNRCVKL